MRGSLVSVVLLAVAALAEPRDETRLERVQRKLEDLQSVSGSMSKSGRRRLVQLFERLHQFKEYEERPQDLAALSDRFAKIKNTIRASAELRKDSRVSAAVGRIASKFAQLQPVEKQARQEAFAQLEKMPAQEARSASLEDDEPLEDDREEALKVEMEEEEDGDFQQQEDVTLQ